MQVYNAAMSEVLENVVKPDLADNEFTEPYSLYHIWLQHERAAAGIALGDFAVTPEMNFFKDRINGIFNAKRWTNLDAPGDLPSDTNRFFVDSMSLVFYSSIPAHYQHLYACQSELLIADRCFTPRLLGVETPQGSGIVGYDQNAGSSWMNNGQAIPYARYSFPQVIEIERVKDKFSVLLRWNAWFQGAAVTNGSEPWTILNTYLAAASGDLGKVVLGFIIHGVRVRRVS